MRVCSSGAGLPCWRLWYLCRLEEVRRALTRPPRRHRPSADCEARDLPFLPPCTEGPAAARHRQRPQMWRPQAAAQPTPHRTAPSVQVCFFESVARAAPVHPAAASSKLCRAPSLSSFSSLTSASLRSPSSSPAPPASHHPSPPPRLPRFARPAWPRRPRPPTTSSTCSRSPRRSPRPPPAPSATSRRSRRPTTRRAMIRCRTWCVWLAPLACCEPSS